MKRLAFLSFAIATLVAPIQVQAQTGCVRFPQPPNPNAELRYLLSHPGAVVCPGPRTDPAGQTATVGRGMIDQAAANARLRCSMSGRVC
jgi:hypothetical protein